jgi:SAM-dependent methyltransferase
VSEPVTPLNSKGPTRDYLWLHLRDLPFFRAMLRSVEAEFYQEYEMAPPVLDVGCGDGHFAKIAFDRPLEAGIDPRYGPIREAAKLGGYRLLVQGDGGLMPFSKACFGSALSNSVLEHIPHVEAVLEETARVLRPGAQFAFCVPNPGYLSELSIPAILKRVGLGRLGEAYREWFRRMSRVQHADPPEVWQARLEEAGFCLDSWWHYFSPKAMRMLEWGHYFGAPSLLARWLTGRWILVSARWNLALTERLVRPHAQAAPHPEGVFTFYVAHKL